MRCEVQRGQNRHRRKQPPPPPRGRRRGAPTPKLLCEPRKLFPAEKCGMKFWPPSFRSPIFNDSLCDTHLWIFLPLSNLESSMQRWRSKKRMKMMTIHVHALSFSALRHYDKRGRRPSTHSHSHSFTHCLKSATHILPISNDIKNKEGDFPSCIT